MNLPNKLTLIRLGAVPVYTTVLLLPINAAIRNVVASVLFFLTAVTDFLDGHIARKYKLVTDFGKFLDPVADKMMIFGALCGLMYINRYNNCFFICLIAASFVFFMREIGITALRMVANSKQGAVLAAGILGKIKTVSQIVFVIAALLEPVVFGTLFNVNSGMIISYITLAFMTAMTLISGIHYLKAYLPLINTNNVTQKD